MNTENVPSDDPFSSQVGGVAADEKVDDVRYLSVEISCRCQRLFWK
jgi:hypothetical protein